MEFLEATSFTKVKAWLSLNDSFLNEARISQLPNEQIAKYFNFTSYYEMVLDEMWIELPQIKKWTCCVCKDMFSKNNGKFDWKVRLVHTINCFHSTYAMEKDEPFIVRVSNDVTLVVHPEYMEYHTMNQKNEGFIRNLPRLKITDNFSEMKTNNTDINQDKVGISILEQPKWTKN